ncbi:hypothetical protein EPD60_03275 [Flaviaesturariibacter flavus]|uniref:Uncharacterized protein n=1 Tax=Flaviaesturariibacter flavus TaxID=2502780 RepID=A0A4R1BN85_9BACT|nr:hypothetical protein [Flaviaesturariibacter flavus]TCJ18795.1 hypothetical protein EPD60_03275 [Flaviaesturariibacter flavus]
MKLEYLNDITAGGKYPLADPDKLIRLYAFTPLEARELCRAIGEQLVSGHGRVEVHGLNFVQALNCTLTLIAADKNEGIALPADGKNFRCLLTREAYTTMASLVGHFANPGHALIGYHWLYVADEEQVDLLLSPRGTW